MDKQRLACNNHYQFSWIDEIGVACYSSKSTDSMHIISTKPEVTSIQGIPNCKSIVCTEHHTAVLTMDGEVYIQSININLDSSEIDGYIPI